MSRLESARRFLKRILDGGEGSMPDASSEPPAPLPSAPERSEVDEEFADLLEGIGVESDSAQDASGVSRRDFELEELREMLARLRPLGDELARTECERQRLAERCTQLEGRREHLEERLAELQRESDQLRQAKDPDPSRRERSLERRLEEREGVLARERERLAQARRQRDERNQVAANRWREIRALRARLRELELAAQPER